MKRILKSLLLLALVGFTTVKATQAYFSSTVTANENVIKAGTLLMGLASTKDLTATGTAYNLAYDRLMDDGGVLNNLAKFPALENMQPGQSQVVYFSVYNRGTLPFNFRFAFDGDWTNLPNYSSDSGLKDRVKITRIDRLATRGWVSGEYGPYNINNWLVGYGFVWDNEAVAGAWGATAWNEYRAEGATLEPKQFQVYKVTFTLDPEAPNAYQGATFLYEIDAQAKQTNATW